MTSWFKNPWGQEKPIINLDIYDNSLLLEYSLNSVDNNVINNNAISAYLTDNKLVKCFDALGTKNLKAVTSFTLEQNLLNSESLWKFVVNKFKDRDKLINELLAMAGLPAPDIEVLQYLKTGRTVNDQGLWNYMRQNVYNPNFDYKVYIENDFLEFHRNYDAAIEDELSKLEELNHARYKILKSSITGKNQFHETYKKFVKIIIKIKEEKLEKDRFDDYFSGAQVQKVLKLIPNITFYPSEIKALIYKESGDLTNTNIAGIVDDDKGLKSPGLKNPSYIGIAQIGLDAMSEGKKWALRNEIRIDTNQDPRTVPESAIILCACILASNYELYLSKVFKYTGDCINWKKVIIGSYNWSGPSMAQLIKQNNTINWSILLTKTAKINSAIKSIPAQTRDYVEKIVDRL